MLLRLALKLLTPLLLLSACSSPDRQVVDKLNSLSYAYHYRNLDSTEHYARQAYTLSEHYDDGRAEALNNLAFVSITRMEYDQAKLQLDSISELTDNQLELLVADVLQMRLCQRRSHNREFYDYRAHALKALKRIDEERASLSEPQQLRLCYAESELAIVTSTYYYYVGLERQSIEALQSVGAEVERDTAQWMNFLYNVGAGGIIDQGSHEEIEQREFECLMQCYSLSLMFGSPYFEANALEALAEHLIDDDSRQRLYMQNYPAFTFLNLGEKNIEQLPVILAEKALDEFSRFGDVYQIAGALRTLASCSRALGDYKSALNYLEQALADSVINQAPDLVASIREQLSVAYAAINDKELSDLNRNIYLDLQEQTRQDRSLEARAGQLDATVAQLNYLLLAIVFVLLLLIVVLRLLFVFHRRRQHRQERIDELTEQREELEEQMAMALMKKREGERRNLEQRAKVSLVNSITPLIDRMLHDVLRIAKQPEPDEESLLYVKELTEKINEQNQVLTQWIQLRQGELSLHIETFELQQLFDIIRKGQRSFTLKGINLEVVPTEAKVKADRVLTLFMLNTLADNARKFTESGGSVTISAKDEPDFVEISVADTGRGMDEEELSHVFDHKLAGGHGFGLLNCRGIIEKYKKTSQIFSVCKLAAESTKGVGSRFFFRLPKGIVRIFLLLLTSSAAMAQNSDSFLQKASSYADSAYFSNINGAYVRTLDFADSCCHYLNSYYLQQYPAATDTLQAFGSSATNVPEIAWLHKGVPVNFNILLGLRNESAVAALALHEWQLYQYNNRIYTLLFKEMSADRTLDDYCRKMQQSQSDRIVAIVLLFMMVLTLLVIIAIQMVQAMGRRAAREQEQQNELELIGDELRRIELEEARLHVSNQVLENCLSALKHETMYYPSRICQLIDAGNTSALPEVVVYYRELYGILSEQANRQLEGMKLHLSRLDHDILGDKTLIDYLFEILRKQARQKRLEIDYLQKDENYVVCEVRMPGIPATDFLPAVDNLSYLLCRQIMREHGEATGKRACGIRAEQTKYGSLIIITLPKYLCRTSK